MMEWSSASVSVVPNASEDSVDIYDGLDVGICSHAGKSSPTNADLKESLDLFEDIVAEEQLIRESSYIELKSKFQAAQNQIKEFRQRLEQMEIQNTGLSKENHCLKKNISALLRTARQEVMRKDAEILKLTQWTDRSCLSHHSRINSHKDLNCSSRTSKMSSMSGSIPLPASAPPPPSAYSQSKEDLPSGHQLQPSRTKRDTVSRPSEASPHRPHKRDTEVKRTQSDKKIQSPKLSEPRDGRHKDCSRLDRKSHTPKEKQAQREDKDAGRKCELWSCQNRKHPSVQEDCQLGVVKNSQENVHSVVSSSDHNKGVSQEQRPGKVKRATVDCDNDYGSKEDRSPEHRKTKHCHKHKKHSDLKDQKQSSHQHDERHGEREGSRKKDYQRNRHKGHEDEIVRKHHRRRSHSKTSREHDKKRPKELKPGEVDPSGKQQERTHKAAKRSAGEPVMDANRKLCFMETLNLTLSPNKKPVRPKHVSPNEQPPADKGAEEDPQINMEDMCVIDEIDNSELEADSVTEQLSDPKATNPETIQKTFDDTNDEQDRESNEAAGTSVQTSFIDSQSLCTAGDQMTVHLTPKSSESTSLKAAGSSEYKDELTVVSNSELIEHKISQVTDKTHFASTPKSTSDHYKSQTPQNICTRNTTDPSVTEQAGLDSKITSLPTKFLQNATEIAVASQSKDTNDSKGVTETASHTGPSTPPIFSPQTCQQDLCPPSTSDTSENLRSGKQDGTRCTDSVSSTTSLDSVPQEGLSLTEAISVLTQSNAADCSTATNQSSPSSACIGVSKVSSTTEEKMLPETCSIHYVTPKKSLSQTNIQGTNMETSSSVPLLHDEDSMMRTLNSIKRIPDAISPLRSPVRITKESLIVVQNKPGHVKTLHKDFSTAAEPSSTKPDVNKENKYPGSLANCEAQNLVNGVSDIPSSLSETDLEEGEILSETEEVASSSPAPATKRAKLVEPVRKKTSPTPVLKKKPEESGVASKETRKAVAVSTHSPRSRFKTVCPAASKTSFSTIEDIMETFNLVRSEIRKKYMKLHKTFPKKSFYGVMDNFQKSFVEFVDGAYFGQICFEAGELKSKLKKLIASVFSKLLDNGIVKRIFEQQAADLKQKLWDFVDVQVDYLFKEINRTLKSFCKPAKALTDEMSSKEEKDYRPAPANPESNLKEESLNRTNSHTVTSYKTGLGSRGKGIRMTCAEKDSSANLHPTNSQNTPSVVEFLPCKKPQTPEKNKISFVVSQNCSVLEKTDFELLTEQQTSSLTYNLVRDSQMGEIFKCLLQGSDLLENSRIGGDNTAWSLGTPRKDEDRFLSITTPSKFASPSKLLSPTKFDTPAKLLATWNSISPCKLSPRTKEQITLNPALFDESCLLEVPSESRVLLHASLASQKSYSILAEDLAVSLTLPSPLKSDSHLSFLQPSSLSMQTLSTPDSIISAHIGEDALLDEEDAMEQDIHLSLDTDNSSSDTSCTAASEIPATPFVFNPAVPMKALVTEKSNDHFVVKIQHVNAGVDVTRSETLTNQGHQHKDYVFSAKQSQKGFADKHPGPSCALPSESNFINGAGNSGTGQTHAGPGTPVTLQGSITLLNNPPQKSKGIQQNPSKATELKKNQLKVPPSLDSTQTSSSSEVNHTSLKEEIPSQECPSKVFPSETQKPISSSEAAVSSSCLSPPPNSTATNQSRASRARISDTDRDETDGSEFNNSLTIDTSSSPEKVSKNHDKIQKRKKRQEKRNSKRSRTEEGEIRLKITPSKKKNEKSKPSPPVLSPNSLSAKNVVRKKGEVVMAWTRDEDRAILMNLKTDGPSQETFSALSEKLNKPTEQIAHRFYQLMALFKKQKVDT